MFHFYNHDTATFEGDETTHRGYTKCGIKVFQFKTQNNDS